MQRRAASRTRGELLAAVLALLPTAAAAAQSDANGILDRLSGGKTSALRGVILDWRETTPASKGAKPQRLRCLAALRYPDRMRLEVRDPRKSPLVYKKAGRNLWIGPAGGPFVELGGPEAEELERRFLLLGTLIGWDLLDGKARMTGDLLESNAAWHTKEAPVIRRHLDAERQATTVSIGTRKYSLRPSKTRGLPPEVVAGKVNGAMQFRRCSVDAEFEDSYFSPVTEGVRKIRRGGERQNFAAPTLEHLTKAWQLTVDCPEGWDHRLRRLGSLGLELHTLGQGPAGLPAFTKTGKMLVFFRPNKKGDKPRVPEGHRPVARPAGVAAVLYAKGTWKKVCKDLETRLRDFAGRLGHKSQAVRFIPYLLPGESAVPKTDTVLLVRGEIDLR